MHHNIYKPYINPPPRPPIGHLRVLTAASDGPPHARGLRGRQRPLTQGLSLATGLLPGKGRPVMRQILLGQGPADESYTGLVVLQAQVKAAQISPSIEGVLDQLVTVFCKHLDDVKR